MTADDFIRFSGELASQATIGPAGFRSAASRAYYGAFHAAKAALQEHGFFCRNRDNEHLWVQRHFQNCTSDEPKSLGQLLMNLHENRKDADYRFDKAYANSQTNAQTCVARAIEIQRLLAVCLDTALREKVRLELVNYRNRTGTS